MIDLHLHTTASDGRLSADELVQQAVAAGITVMSVTDHDTLASVAAAARAAAAVGIEVVTGVEVTAVHSGRDVHMLGYFIDVQHRGFSEFLVTQREKRTARAQEIIERLAELGVPIAGDALLRDAASRPGAAVGRPALARAMVAAGHVGSVQEAFDRYLAAGRAAFVARVGPSPRQVIEEIHRAGGLASMAHPGVSKQPELMRALADEGLDAVEVFHPDHPTDLQHELLAFAAINRLLVTGGSDFHGDGRRRLAGSTLPAEYYASVREARANAASRPAPLSSPASC